MTIEQDPPASPVEEAHAPEATAPAWGPAQKILFRFAFSYLFLYLFSSFLELLAFIPGAGVVAEGYERIWVALVPGVSQRLFHAEAVRQVTGSGDTMFAWVESFCFLAISLLVTLVWTLLDRKRAHYAKLHEWLKVYVRLGLAMIMIEYGGLKIIPSQFPRPSLDRLMQPFGDASPMGLLWTFMGASAPYTTFAGLTEWLGGVLLVFRRTALLGALVSIGALTNVVMLNFCYDVPVKLFSSHLLAMAIFLVLPDLRRLAALFVLNRPVPAAPDPHLVRRRSLRYAGLAFQVLFAVGFSFYMIYSAHLQLSSYESARSPLRGVWSVDDLQVDGQAGAPADAEDLHWRRLIFDYPSVIAVQLTSDARRRYALKLDEAKKTLGLTRRDDPKWKTELTYGRPDPDHLTVEGAFGGRRIRARLHRIDERSFLLVSRGFHWVSEFPFNR
jgi:hypothetical protein